MRKARLWGSLVDSRGAQAMARPRAAESGVRSERRVPAARKAVTKVRPPVPPARRCAVRIQTPLGCAKPAVLTPPWGCAGQRAAPAHARPAGSPKPARLNFDGVKPVQQLWAEASPFAFTPTGEPGEIDQIDHTPRRKADAALRRGQMQPTLRDRTPTDGVSGGRRDVAAQALLALLGGSGDAAKAQGRDLPRRRLQNRAELVRQARLAHHRLRESLGVPGT